MVFYSKEMSWKKVSQAGGDFFYSEKTPAGFDALGGKQHVTQ